MCGCCMHVFLICLFLQKMFHHLCFVLHLCCFACVIAFVLFHLCFLTCMCSHILYSLVFCHVCLFICLFCVARCRKWDPILMSDFFCFVTLCRTRGPECMLECFVVCRFNNRSQLKCPSALLCNGWLLGLVFTNVDY